jgi:hypothetical protein
MVAQVNIIHTWLLFGHKTAFNRYREAKYAPLGGTPIRTSTRPTRSRARLYSTD